MARHISSRLKITGELVAETPLHVGGYGESFETDLALARNGKDEFYIPGTSLTGALRGWFEKNFPNDVNDLWGFQIGDQGHASFVLIEDLMLPEQVQSELRDGVGIDRFYGTAADKGKFDRAILPKGTRLKLEMTVDMQGNENKVKPMFRSLLEALQNGQIRLGASKTRGLGKVKCGQIGIEEWSLYDPKDILDAVEKKPTNKYQINNLKGTQANGPQLLTMTIGWKPKSPVMVKAAYEGIGVDTLPLSSGNGKNKVSLCLPGSSIKGAFRAHAERIMRTLLDCPDQEERYRTKNKQNFHDQIKKIPLIDELFGAKKERTGQAKHLGLGALSIDDCYAKTLDANIWSEVEAGEMKDDKTYSTQPLWKALKKIEGDNKADTTNFKISHHVAIDRWTGGSAEGALYSVLQPTAAIDWDEICLTLDLSRLRGAGVAPDETLKKRCLMLLLLVLRGLAENRLPLGFAANRGMGEVIIEKIEGLSEIPKLLGLEGESFEAEIKSGTMTFKGDKVKEKLKEVWAYE